MAIENPGFRPVATPVNTVATPARPVEAPRPVAPVRPMAPEAPTPIRPPEQTNSLMQFASALASLNPQINEYLTRMYSQEAEEANKDYAFKLQAMKPEEAEQYYRTQRDALSPMYQAALDKQYGVLVGNNERRQIEADIAAGKINLLNQRIDDVIKERTTATLEKYQSQHFMEGYRAVMAMAVPGFRDAQAKAQSAETIAQVHDNFTQLVTSMIQDGKAAGRTPEEIAEAIRGLYATHGPGTVFNLDNRTMDELVQKSLTWAADQGMTDVIDAVMTKPRKLVNKPTNVPDGSDAVWSHVLNKESGGKQLNKDGKPLTSSHGAVGIAQVMPETAEWVAKTILKQPFDKERFETDATYNEQLGRAYYDHLLDKYDGNHALALAAYNAGPTRVKEWIEKNGDPRTGKVSSEDWARRIPFKETRGYVTDILAKAAVTDEGKPAVIPAMVSVPKNAQLYAQLRQHAEQRQNHLTKEANFGYLVDLYTQAANGKLDPEFYSKDKERLEKMMTPVQVAGLLHTNQEAIKQQQKLALQAAVVQQQKDIESRVLMDAASVVISGNPHELTSVNIPLPADPTKSVTMTRKELMDKALHLAMQSQVVTGADGKIDPDATFTKQVFLLSNKGLVYEPWKNVIEGGAEAFNFAQDSDQARQTLTQGYEMYRRMKALSPTIARKHAPGTAATIYDAIELNETELTGGNRDEAVRQAIRMQDPKMKDMAEARYTNLKPSDKKGFIEDLRKNERFMLLFGDTADKENMLGIEHKLDSLAKDYSIIGGVTPKKAYELAAKRIAQTHTTVNGMLIDTSNADLPPNYKELSAFAADRYVKAHGHDDGISSASDLVLIPDQSSKSVFFLYNKKTGLGVDWARKAGEDGLPMGFFSVGQLQQLDRLRQDAQKAQIAKEQAAYQEGLKTTTEQAKADVKAEQAKVYAGQRPDQLPIIDPNQKAIGGVGSGAAIEVGPVQWENFPWVKEAGQIGQWMVENGIVGGIGSGAFLQVGPLQTQNLPAADLFKGLKLPESTKFYSKE